VVSCNRNARLAGDREVGKYSGELENLEGGIGTKEKVEVPTAEFLNGPAATMFT
jgi:hypothetical protein